jgi:diaminopimelate epimerase
MAAARAVYSLAGRIDPERSVVVRNIGGMATVSLQVRGTRWRPVVEGNATFVYRADLDPAALARGDPAALARESCDEEVRAYSVLDQRNAGRLRAAGVDSAGLPA